MFYKLFIRRFLFFFKPEVSHYLSIRILKIFFMIPGFNYFVKWLYAVEDKKLHRNFFGLFFKNPVGLAAGFDKNAQFFNEFSSFGFGFIEIGTVTPLAQEGNPKPRLFRLQKDHALINRMGFNNDGIDQVVNRLKKRYTNIVIGGNIGKNKLTDNAFAFSDYTECLEKIAPYVDYLTLNISSPNTPNLVELQNAKDLKILLSKVQELNQKKYHKPILIKISPDLKFSQIDQIIDLVYEFNISGIIATNTSSSRDNLITDKKNVTKKGAGGLSGKPIYLKSKKIVSYISKKTSGKIPIVAVGGIMTARDALDMLDCGASLVQIYTGFVYNGPSIIKDINNQLLRT